MEHINPQDLVNPSAIFDMVIFTDGDKTQAHKLVTFPELLTKEGIEKVLSNPNGMTRTVPNSKIIYKFLQKMYDRQTVDEQYSHSTKCLNGVGFNSLDAGFLSSVAKGSVKYSSLSKGQLPLVARMLHKYIRQLIEIANTGY